MRKINLIKMLEKLSLQVVKFWFPGILIIVGLILLISGITPDENSGVSQTQGFVYGALSILAMGVITALYMADIISRGVQVILMVILLIVTTWLTITTISSIKDTIAKIEKKTRLDGKIKQALVDIMDIQVEFKKKNGTYAKDFDALRDFLIYGEIYDISPRGSVPDGKISPEYYSILEYDAIENEKEIEEWDEAEALKAGVLKYDTTWIPVFEQLFTGEAALEKERVYPFQVANLALVPENEEKIQFTMQTAYLPDSIPAVRIFDPAPYDPFEKLDTLAIGSLASAKQSGNWVK